MRHPTVGKSLALAAFIAWMLFGVVAAPWFGMTRTEVWVPILIVATGMIVLDFSKGRRTR